MAASLPVRILAGRWETPAGHWIQSAAFDLAFFVLAPLVMLPVTFGALHWHNAFALVGFVLAFAHYASSFTFYLWDENRAHHRARWGAFFAGPLLITATFCALVIFRVPLIVQVVLFFWNAVHVSRQSCGILSLYRHRAGVADPREKRAANGAILAVNLWFCLWNIETHAEVQPVLMAISKQLPLLLWLGSGVVAAGALARALATLWRRGSVGLPELGLFVASLALFHPYLWIPDSARATFAMLLPHYVQYLGLVWLVHRRRVNDPSASRRPALLQQISANLPGLVLTLAAIGLGLFALKEALGRVGQLALFEAAYLLIAFLHFYVDGLFWAFKDPHVRRTLGPYLMHGSPAASALR
ncbi:MAG TPA: hypothetical protein VFM88_23920 [Vicinamibacteria bacterium]|nr:hypothetical protein [Vicinamibacteria bacterium]